MESYFTFSYLISNVCYYCYWYSKSIFHGFHFFFQVMLVHTYNDDDLTLFSTYFFTLQNLFKSNFLNDKHPVVFMKDMEFENLKSLVEYMYKGEANVPQQMLTAFIKDAESLQIRGLAEGANKMIETEGILNRPPVQHSTPINKKSKHSNAHQGKNISMLLHFTAISRSL